MDRAAIICSLEEIVLGSSNSGSYVQKRRQVQEIRAEQNGCCAWLFKVPSRHPLFRWFRVIIETTGKKLACGFNVEAHSLLWQKKCVFNQKAARVYTKSINTPWTLLLSPVQIVCLHRQGALIKKRLRGMAYSSKHPVKSLWKQSYRESPWWDRFSYRRAFAF